MGGVRNRIFEWKRKLETIPSKELVLYFALLERCFLGLKMSEPMEVESSPKETPKEETSPKALQEAEVDEMKKYVRSSLFS